LGGFQRIACGKRTADARRAILIDAIKIRFRYAR
jgi:hypothetical protein